MARKNDGDLADGEEFYGDTSPIDDEFDEEGDEEFDEDLDSDELDRQERARKQIGWGFAVVDGKRLDFWLSVNGAELLKAEGVERKPMRDSEVDTTDFIRWWNKDQIERAEAIEAVVREVAPDVRVRAPVEFGGPAAAGPGVVEGLLLSLLVSDDPVGRIADLIEIAGAVWVLKGRLRAKSGHEVGISDGVAVMAASKAVKDAFGSIDTELVEVVELHPNNLDRAGTPEGYMVSLKDEEYLYTVVVSFAGMAAVPSRLPLTALTPMGSIVPEPDYSSDEDEGLG